ncbi:MAG: AI-2E family transporter [Bacteroidia bacterium]|nr:MAG: AI-2E family transporter [Bacteroidia bacterium]
MRDFQKYIAAFVGIVFLVFVVWYFSAIVAYILIAVVMSFIGRPIIEGLGALHIGRFKMPRAMAATITLLILWTIFILFFYYLTPLVINEFRALKEVDFTKVSANLKEPVAHLNAMLSSFYGEPIDSVNLKEPVEHLNAMLSSFYGESIDSVAVISSNLKELFNTKNTVGVFNSLTTTVSGLFVALFSITFMTFFFLKDSNLFMKGVSVFTPLRYENNVNEAFLSIKKLLVRYFLGVFLEVIIIFTLITIGLSIVGIPINTALTIALIAGCLNVIPYIGPLIGAIMGVLIVMLNNIDLPLFEEFLPLLGFTALVFAIVQLIDNIVLQPLIYSSSVFAHPLEIFLLILVAGSLAGPIGMILAVPAYTILRVVGYEFFAQYEIVKRLTKGISHERSER